MAKKEILPRFREVLIGKMGVNPHDDALDAAHPLLYKLMMPENEGKHLVREPGVITIRVDGSLYRITLVCPTEMLQTTLETATLMDVLAQLELHCQKASTTWIPTYDSKKKARRALDKLDARE